MLALFVAAGLISEGSGPGAGSGLVDVPKVRLAVAAQVQGAAQIGNGIPFGSASWPQPFDPADHLPYAFSFEFVLDEGDHIVAVERIALSSASAALGVIIDQSSGFAPIVDADSKNKIQLWFSVDPAFHNALPFDAAGTQVPVTFRVLTAKAHRLERTAFFIVRHL